SFASMHSRDTRPTLFPYTTLFRSKPEGNTVPQLSQTAGAMRVMAGKIRPLGAPDDDMAIHRTLPRRARSRLRVRSWPPPRIRARSEEHTSELQSRVDLVCRLLLAK